MPRYFFDIRDRGRRVRDVSGMDLGDIAQAIREATVIIEQITAGTETRPGTVSVTVRTEGAACLYEASISLAGD